MAACNSVAEGVGPVASCQLTTFPVEKCKLFRHHIYDSFLFNHLFFRSVVNADLKPYFLMVVDGKFIYRHEPGLIEYNKSPIYESTSNSILGKRLIHLKLKVNSNEISKKNIALAVHARQGTLFMADHNGFVYELSLKPKSYVLNLWSVDKEIVHVRGLSVDWLFDRLYLLLENAEGTSWLISRCKLDGREPTHVVTDILHRPSHFEVDPFNG